MRPHCYKCKRPVFFIQIMDGFDLDRNKKPIPLDVDPDPNRGSIALADWPLCIGRNNWNPPGVVPEKVGRRVYGEAAKMFRSLGGSLYRIHWDSCRGY